MERPASLQTENAPLSITDTPGWQPQPRCGRSAKWVLEDNTLPVHDVIHIPWSWDLYFDICERHILPARVLQYLRSSLHLTNPCAKRKVLSLTKPKGKIYKMKSLGHYITVWLERWWCVWHGVHKTIKLWIYRYLSCAPPNGRGRYSAFLRWVRAQDCSPDTPNIPKNAPGPVDLSLKKEHIKHRTINLAPPRRVRVWVRGICLSRYGQEKKLGSDYEVEDLSSDHDGEKLGQYSSLSLSSIISQTPQKHQPFRE